MSRGGASRMARLLAAACLAPALWVGTAATAGEVAQDSAQGAAQAGTPPDPSATPQPGASVRDPDFGVVARHYGLRRHVEMFQWRRRGDGGYERAWSDTALDSSGFAPGHDNPPFPLRNRHWQAKQLSVDGVPLDPAVVSTLGRWTPFRPSFSALPGNLAATFQPQGDGLGTAENPMAPAIGDLRIHWLELRLPPLAGRIVLDGGRWRLRQGAAKPASRSAAGADGVAPPPAATGPRFALLAALVLSALAAFVAFRWLRARRRRGREPRR